METNDCVCYPLCYLHGVPRPCPICDKGEKSGEKMTWNRCSQCFQEIDGDYCEFCDKKIIVKGKLHTK